MKKEELRNLEREELVNKYNALQKELYALNYQRKMGRVEKPHHFKLIKKDIARILTILNEKK